MLIDSLNPEFVFVLGVAEVCQSRLAHDIAAVREVDL